MVPTGGKVWDPLVTYPVKFIKTPFSSKVLTPALEFVATAASISVSYTINIPVSARPPVIMTQHFKLVDVGVGLVEAVAELQVNGAFQIYFAALTIGHTYRLCPAVIEWPSSAVVVY